MTAYLPAFELDFDTIAAIQEGDLPLQNGQWVTWRGAKGRIVKFKSKITILWRFCGESFRSFLLRFRKALAPQRARNRRIPNAEQLSLFSSSASDEPHDNEAVAKPTVKQPKWVRMHRKTRTRPLLRLPAFVVALVMDNPTPSTLPNRPLVEPKGDRSQTMENTHA